MPTLPPLETAAPAAPENCPAQQGRQPGEYGWEQWGRRLAVGDVVRSGHPRADASTAVVVEVCERGDGEQLSGLHWDGRPVTYWQPSATLVRVPAAQVSGAPPGVAGGARDLLALPAAPVRLTLAAGPVGPLLTAEESLAPYRGSDDALDRIEDADYVLTTAYGHTYRLTEDPLHPGDWCISRMPFRWSSSNGGYLWWSGNSWERPLGRALEWIRRDSAFRALATGRWERWGHLTGAAVPFSVALETQELEPGVLRVARFGRQAITADYPWGWETSRSGEMQENPGRRYSDGVRLELAAHHLTVRGLHEVGSERLRIVGADWAGAEDCAVGGPNHLGSCKRVYARRTVADPRFVVEVHSGTGASLGRVVICAAHLAPRLVGDDRWFRDVPDQAHRRSEGRGSWLDWRERAVELSWDLVAPVVDRRRRPLWVTEAGPGVRAALMADADRVGAQRRERAAKKAAQQARAEQRAARSADREAAAAPGQGEPVQDALPGLQAERGPR